MSEVVVKSTENGPNLVIVNGKVVQAWCRCGGSTLMPFCDGSHKRNGFVAKTHEVKVRQSSLLWRIANAVAGRRMLVLTKNGLVLIV